MVSVSSLLQALWGDDPPPSGTGSIQAYVSRLRRALGPDAIETAAPGYRLDSRAVSLDATEFLDLASTLPDDPGGRLQAIESAVTMWRGPPFEDFEHLDFAAHRLTETRYDLEEEKARLLAAKGELTNAVGVLDAITAAEPLRESVWVAKGLILAAAGRQAEAVRTLDGYRSNLADVGLEPGIALASAETRVFESPSTPPQRPALVDVETSFIGRQSEKTDLEKLLIDNRLVCVVGPGGMGKTRLAVAVARAWQASDVVFVRLDGLRDDHEVAPAVLRALGGETRGDPTRSVIALLANLEAPLMVLDNAEHVIDSVAALVNEMVGSTAATLLVTSREPLSIAGETVLTLGPMAPGDAVELFRDRARSVNPALDAPAATLDMLCEELDYMPLAIEMAASRAKALLPDEILTRIDRRYELFATPRRSGAERHRTLDAMVEWSYDLLDPTSQRVFERLSVIVRTFDIELATAVAGFGDVPSDLVTTTVARLMERSLVERSSSGSFRMLGILKSFARQRLESGPDSHRAHDLHARWFADLARQIGHGLSTPHELTWIDKASNSVEDLRSALLWSAEHREPEVTQTILEGLFDWFYHRHPPAVTDWGEVVLEATRGHDAYAAASAWAALAAVKRHDMETAAQLASQGTTVDGPAGRFAWYMTGEVACYLGHLEHALDAFRRQMVRASQVDDRIGVLDALAAETLVLAYEGVFDRAIEVAGDLERAGADVMAPTYRAYTQHAKAEAIMTSEPEQAADLFETAVALATSVNNHYIQALARTSLGSVLARVGRHGEAVESLREAIGLWNGLGVPSYHWASIHFLGAVLAQTGDSENGARLIAAAEYAGRGAFSAGQAHWSPVVESLRAMEGYDEWAADGTRLDLALATELALTATRQRR